MVLPEKRGRRADGSVVVLILLMACAGGPDISDAVVRDSAGIRIVEVAALPPADLGWSLSDEPRVLIGGDAADDRAQLFRVSGVARRSDGGILIGNSGTSELRLFDADGAPAGSFGRGGGGPGEFSALTLAGVLPGDSALLHDGRQGRLTVVTPEMTLGRTAPTLLNGQAVRVQSKGLLAGGPLIATGSSRLSGSASSGVIDPEAPLYLVGLDGTIVDSAGAFTGRPLYLETGGRGMNLTRIPFGTETQIATGPDRLHVATGDAWEVRSFDRSGRLVQILRVDESRRSVTDADIASFVEQSLARANVRNSASLRQVYDRITYPAEMPAYGDVRTDAAGHLWIQDYPAPGDPPLSWTVFDRGGRPLGRIALPAGVRVEEIGADYLLGAGADDLGRVYVALWALDRNENP